MIVQLLAAAALYSPPPLDVQTYDPGSGKSPLVLLQAPADGVAYYQLKERARALYRADERWAEAEPVMEQLVRAYPRDPENWTMLSRTKRRLKKFDEAAAAAAKAAPLLGEQADYLIALNAIQAGNKRAALDGLRHAIFARGGIIRQSLIDYYPGFEPLKNDAEFREITGNPDTAGWSREQGWAHDLKFFYDEVKRVNPDYRERPFPAEFERRYAQLVGETPTLSDEQLFVGMQRLLAILHQGHLTLWADDKARVPNRFLPLRFYAFPEGLYVIDADAGHKNLIGSRVDGIGTLTADEALRRLAETNSVDGDMAHLWSAPRLGESYYLKGLGGSKTADSIDLAVVGANGKRRSVSVATVATAPYVDQVNRPDKLLAPGGVAAPMFLSNMKDTFWHRPLADRDAFYVQVNNLVDSERESLDDYGRRLWGDLDRLKPRDLILDLRHNNGGSTQLYPNLLRSLIAFSRVPGNQIYVLIGRRTYSAAGNFVTDLERLADPIFVGEASSECCNLYGDPAEIFLPYSRIKGEFTAMKWNLSTPSDRRREISPEVPVQLTAKAYFAGLDPVIDAVFELIASTRTAGKKTAGI